MSSALIFTVILVFAMALIAYIIVSNSSGQSCPSISGPSTTTTTQGPTSTTLGPTQGPTTMTTQGPTSTTLGPTTTTLGPTTTTTTQEPTSMTTTLGPTTTTTLGPTTTTLGPTTTTLGPTTTTLGPTTTTLGPTTTTLGPMTTIAPTTMTLAPTTTTMAPTTTTMAPTTTQGPTSTTTTTQGPTTGQEYPVEVFQNSNFGIMSRSFTATAGVHDLGVIGSIKVRDGARVTMSYSLGGSTFEKDIQGPMNLPTLGDGFDGKNIQLRIMSPIFTIQDAMDRTNEIFAFSRQNYSGVRMIRPKTLGGEVTMNIASFILPPGVVVRLDGDRAVFGPTSIASMTHMATRMAVAMPSTRKPTASRQSYKGCWKENDNYRKLKYVGTGTSAADCARKVKSQGYTFAAVRGMGECYGASSMLSINMIGTQDDDKYCKFECNQTGEPKVMTEPECGSNELNSTLGSSAVYDTNLYDKPDPTTLPPIPDDEQPRSDEEDLAKVQVLGCYNDDRTSVMGAQLSNVRTNNKPFTTCRNTAHQQGYKYFGIKNKGWCFGVSDPQKLQEKGPIAENMKKWYCNYKCTGTSQSVSANSPMCGGGLNSAVLFATGT
jgi:hypothetical protein